PALVEQRRRVPLRGGGSALSRMFETRQVVHIADLPAERAYTLERNPGTVTAVELGGVRTVVWVPMLKESEIIGFLSITDKWFGPSPTSRSSWGRPSPARPSSPSRTRACSTNCASAPTI